MQLLIGPLFSLLFPKAPDWLVPLITTGLPLVIDMVDALRDVADLSGAEKQRFVVEEARVLLDQGFDHVPEWSELSEERRDRIIAGWVETALFVIDIADDDDNGTVSPRELRRTSRELRRGFEAKLPDFRRRIQGKG